MKQECQAKGTAGKHNTALFVSQRNITPALPLKLFPSFFWGLCLQPVAIVLRLHIIYIQSSVCCHKFISCLPLQDLLSFTLRPTLCGFMMNKGGIDISRRQLNALLQRAQTFVKSNIQPFCPVKLPSEFAVHVTCHKPAEDMRCAFEHKLHAFAV